MRIAIGGIAHETNTFSTLPASLTEFRRESGDALVESVVPDGFALADVELVPLFAAHATPGGPVRRETFRVLLDELVPGIEAALPLDGVLLLLHGAMEVDGGIDGEESILEAVRAVIGREALVSVTLDLHANLSPRVVELSDLFVAYRTAPHRDVKRTRERGLSHLVEALRRGRRPVNRLVKLPLLVAGEAAVTEVEPSRRLFALLEESDAKPGIICASILIGCAWTDSPHDSVSVIVTGSDDERVEEEAAYLASEVWKARNEFAIDSEVAGLEEAVRIALGSEVYPVFISDSGDNTTAGAAGDLPVVLEYLVSRRVEGALVAGIADAEAVSRAVDAGPGASIELAVGGKLDRLHGTPYCCRARVVSVHDSPSSTAGGDSRVEALLRVGTVDVVLRSDRRPFTTLTEFQRIGIDPADYRLVVVKEGYLFPELRDYAKRHIMALTPGFGDQRLEKLPYQRLRRPIHPLDADVSWP